MDDIRVFVLDSFEADAENEVGADDDDDEGKGRADIGLKEIFFRDGEGLRSSEEIAVKNKMLDFHLSISNKTYLKAKKIKDKLSSIIKNLFCSRSICNL